MGVVYYGIHPRLQTEVAVKVLPPSLASAQKDLIERFFAEARLAVRIRSQHLVGVLDVNQEGNLFYLVMEYVNGKSAAGYLAEVKNTGQPGLPEAVALEICLSASRGLGAAHEAKVVHRDIKPDNILLPLKAGTGELLFEASKLADLGIARCQQTDQGLTMDRVTMGTPGYLSPEQALDAKSVGPQADVFSMGATLYNLLTGNKPFAGATAFETLMETVHKPFKPLEALRSGISPATRALVERCLAKAPQERFKDGSALAAALKLCLDVLEMSPEARAKAAERIALL
jgi:serine/threonine protein kinase